MNDKKIEKLLLWSLENGYEVTETSTHRRCNVNNDCEQRRSNKFLALLFSCTSKNNYNERYLWHILFILCFKKKVLSELEYFKMKEKLNSFIWFPVFSIFNIQ